MVVNDDGEDHAWTRRVLELAFTGARVRALIPLMQRRADELIDAFGDGSNRIDLVADYAAPFVRTVVDEVMGLSFADAAQIQAWSDCQILLSNPLAPAHARAEAAKQLGDYTRYMQTLTDERRQERRSDLMSDLTTCPDFLITAFTASFAGFVSLASTPPVTRLRLRPSPCCSIIRCRSGSRQTRPGA